MEHEKIITAMIGVSVITGEVFLGTYNIIIILLGLILIISGVRQIKKENKETILMPAIAITNLEIDGGAFGTIDGVEQKNLLILPGNKIEYCENLVHMLGTSLLYERYKRELRAKNESETQKTAENFIEEYDNLRSRVVAHWGYITSKNRFIRYKHEL